MAQKRTSSRHDPSTVVVPVVHEEVVVGKSTVETGRVRVEKRVSERVEEVTEPILREEVSIERVAVGRVVDGPVESRMDGDTLVIPVLEEVLVVEKRLVIKEELRITKRFVTTDSAPQAVTLRHEDVVVERIAEPSRGPRRS